MLISYTSPNSKPTEKESRVFFLFSAKYCCGYDVTGKRKRVKVS